MKFSAIAATVAFGVAASAIPTAAPAKFAIQITAPWGSPKASKSLYLAKGGISASTEKLEDAASCSINAQAQLICGGDLLGVTNHVLLDMGPLVKIANPTDSNALTKGFSVDGKGLHWKNSAFDSLSQAANIKNLQGGEAAWGFYQPTKSSPVQVYIQLGCPGGTHKTFGMDFHPELVTGNTKIVPL